MSPTLTGSIWAREDLSHSQTEQMQSLLRRHFLGVQPQHFHRDLQAKDQVILLHDHAGALRGFSTLQHTVERVNGERLAVLFSGDTVVDREAWGSPALARAWLEAALRARRVHPDLPLYWLLIASGFRTYRFLPVFFEQFWPRHDAPTPDATQALMACLADKRFGPRHKDGVVQLEGATPVRPEVGGLTERRLRNPHVAHFAALNPGHVRGDELVCLTRVDEQNFTAAARRVLRSLSLG